MKMEMEKNKQNAFMFYLSWSKQIEMLTAEETKSFIQNLIRYHKDEELIFSSKLEEMLFTSIEISLETNKSKYQVKVETNRENGKKGGRPKTQNNPKKPNGYSENPKNPNKKEEQRIKKEETIINKEETIINKEEETNILELDILELDTSKEKIDNVFSLPIEEALQVQKQKVINKLPNIEEKIIDLCLVKNYCEQLDTICEDNDIEFPSREITNFQVLLENKKTHPIENK